MDATFLVTQTSFHLTVTSQTSEGHLYFKRYEKTGKGCYVIIKKFLNQNQSYYNNKEVVPVSFLHSHGMRCKFSICKTKMWNLDPLQSGKTLEAV